MSSKRQFPRKRYPQLIKGILIALGVIAILVIIYFASTYMSLDILTPIRIYSRYAAAALSVIGVICMMYAASGVISQKKTIRCLITAILVTGSLFLYIENRYKPKNAPQQLVEDQLYIRPKSALDEEK